MKKLINTMLLILNSTLFFANGTLLFTSNVSGELQIDGFRPKQCESNEFVKTKLQEGFHLVKFVYRSQILLDTSIQIVKNEQSVIKFNINNLPKASQIEKTVDYSQSQGQSQNVIIDGNSNLDPKYFPQVVENELLKYVISAKIVSEQMVSSQNTHYYGIQKFKLNEGDELSLDFKLINLKLSHLTKELDNAIYGNAEYSTSIKIIAPDGQTELSNRLIDLNKRESTKIKCPQTGIYTLKIESKKYQETVEYVIKSASKSDPITLENTVEEIKYEVVPLQLISDNGKNKHIFSVSIPSQTKYWSYVISTEENLDLASLKAKTLTNFNETEIERVSFFKNSLNERFMNDHSLNRIYFEKESIDGWKVFEPELTQFSIGVENLFNKKNRKKLYAYLILVKV